MLLTPAQLQEISQIIEDRHAAFIVNTMGVDAVPPETLNRLKQLGIIDVKVDSVKDAYLYGQVVGAAEVPGVDRMTYDQFKEHVRKHPVHLTPVENEAIDFARQRSGQYARGLGNKVDLQTGQVIIEADAALRQQMRDEIRTATEESIAKRNSLKSLKSDLGWATKDWTRDWERIANTEKHFAMQSGVKDYIVKRHGPEAFVAVKVMPDACPQCERLYERGGTPILFRLSDLEANGTNVGLKQSEWQPVVPPAHPYCVCQLIHVPPGYGFDEQNRMVPGGERIELGKSEAYWVLKREDDLRKALKVAKHIEYQGIPIAIENPAGSIRHWEADGETGSTKMLYAYGYVKNTEGADCDGVDVFVGPDPKASTAYVIHQQNPKTGIYDEDKVLLGFSNQERAVAAYQAHYDRPDFAVGVSPMPVDSFKRWVAGTAKRPDELSKSDTALVLKIEKSNIQSGGVVRSNEAMAHGMAHAMPAERRATDRGSGVNLVLRNPPAHRPPPVDLVPTGDPHRPKSPPYDDVAVKRDPKVYEYQEPVKPRTMDLVIPEDYRGGIVGTPEVERNKEKVERERQRDHAVVRNTVEPEDSEPKTKAKTKKKGGKRPKRYSKRKDKVVEKDEETGETLH
jgi:hypothetical protein